MLKATGIIRRVDDLGRIVIPKEIRRTLHIREGDPLEIYTSNDGGIVFKKYCPLWDVVTKSGKHLCDVIANANDIKVALTDRDSILAVANMDKSFIGKRLSPNATDIIDKKQVYSHTSLNIFLDFEENVYAQAIIPIIVDYEPVGAIVIIDEYDRCPNHTAITSAKVAADFLAKEMEVY